MLRTPIGRLRIISIVEGISFLLLLGIAMPLKYLADQPEMVSVVGMIHGWLTILFVLAVAHVTFVHRWPIIHALGALVASVIPFGAFVLDRWLQRRYPEATT